MIDRQKVFTEAVASYRPDIFSKQHKVWVAVDEFDDIAIATVADTEERAWRKLDMCQQAWRNTGDVRAGHSFRVRAFYLTPLEETP